MMKDTADCDDMFTFGCCRSRCRLFCCSDANAAKRYWQLDVLATKQFDLHEWHSCQNFIQRRLGVELGRKGPGRKAPGIMSIRGQSGHIRSSNSIADTNTYIYIYIHTTIHTYFSRHI